MLVATTPAWVCWKKSLYGIVCSIPLQQHQTALLELPPRTQYPPNSTGCPVAHLARLGLNMFNMMLGCGLKFCTFFKKKEKGVPSFMFFFFSFPSQQIINQEMVENQKGKKNASCKANRVYFFNLFSSFLWCVRCCMQHTSSVCFFLYATHKLNPAFLPSGCHFQPAMLKVTFSCPMFAILQ